MKKKNNDKLYKILKNATIILLVLLVLELIIFGIRALKMKNDNVYYSTINSILKHDDGYVGVGLSDFKNSKINDYEAPGYSKPVIWLYDSEYNILKESKYDNGYSGVFNDIIETSDGYVAVGALEMTETMHKAGITEGIIVKYDKELNVVWEKNLQILDDTNLVSVKLDKNENVIIVGQSIYEPDIIGNHKNGGAILAIYSPEGEKKQVINYGGPQTGIFNDVVVLDDGYVVVGITHSGTGVIFKYDLNGQEVWHNYYGYTDMNGLTSINYVDGYFIVSGTKLNEKDDTDSYKGSIIKFDNSGQLVKEALYEKDSIAKIDELIISEDKIIALALYGKKENDILVNQSAILEYNFALELVNEQELTGNNTVTFTNVIKNNADYLVVGHTNSKMKQFKTNGHDYYPIFIEYNKNLEQK